MTAKQIKKHYQEGIKEIVKSLKKYDPEKIILFGRVKDGYHPPGGLALHLFLTSILLIWYSPFDGFKKTNNSGYG